MNQSLRFAREFLKDRRQIGAVIPSGGPLARRVLRALGKVEPDQVIVELGPGTGPVTAEIVSTWPDQRLVLVEFLPAFARQLAETFPSVEVVEGDAAHLQQHLEERGIEAGKVGGVVSSLPLLSLDEPTRDRIFEALQAVLRPGRRYVQFTYSKKSWDRFMPEGFELRKSSRVWRNLPPATVLTFVRS